MMATTHVFAGLALAAVVATVAPEFALVAAVAAIAGGGFPDLDLYAGHRRTLHFPVYYSVAALATAPIVILEPTPLSVGVAVFLLAAAVHSASDVLGGGLELRPWEGTSERAVYDHYRGRWLRPRRWVRYDGAPEDFALGVALAIPALAVFDGPVRSVALGLLAISGGYALVRKQLVRAAERLIAVTPDEVVDRLPERFLPLEDEGFDAAD